ncbi:MAG: nitroreductase [Anaerocolumna sp.]|jgi:predicted oxidoreductase (fatty acid repression mutant protein)|nr:nitroreductase [Anaerocolumna sp.]
MNKEFLTAVADRRTFYGISKESVIADDKLKSLIEHAVKHTPSAFNSQSTRVVLLLGNQHDKLWDLTIEELRKVVPAESFSSTEEKISSFKAGYGTVLFFEDNSIIESLQEQFALYKDNFPVWAQQSNGMHQFVIWTALETEGYGASLQHYNELIESNVKNEWSLPSSWKLIAQMPFGKPTGEPGVKEYLPVSDRVKVFE